MRDHIHHEQPILQTGVPLEQAQAAMILLHGRGASAQSILQLAELLPHPQMLYLAPQALRNTWYPYSFLNPISQNEPGLSSALAVIGGLVEQLERAGISAERIVIGGFSQGACLSAEFVARNPRRYGGVLVFSGGLIGPPGTARDYLGSLAETPIFLGCSDTDFHIPAERVRESTVTFRRMGAQVTERIYPNIGHTVIDDELVQANTIVSNV